MQRFSTVLLVLAIVAVPFAVTDAEEPVSDVLQKLAGVWVVEEGVNQGVEIPEDDLDGTTMLVDKKIIITYDRDRNEKYRSTFTLDTSTTPISIDMTTAMNGMPPATSLGILKFDDDEQELEICYALPGSDRPKTFESPKGSKIMLFEVERED